MQRIRLRQSCRTQRLAAFASWGQICVATRFHPKTVARASSRKLADASSASQPTADAQTSLWKPKQYHQLPTRSCRLHEAQCHCSAAEDTASAQANAASKTRVPVLVGSLLAPCEPQQSPWTIFRCSTALHTCEGPNGAIDKETCERLYEWYRTGNCCLRRSHRHLLVKTIFHPAAANKNTSTRTCPRVDPVVFCIKYDRI